MSVRCLQNLQFVSARVLHLASKKIEKPNEAPEKDFRKVNARAVSCPIEVSIDHRDFCILTAYFCFKAYKENYLIV